MSVGGVQIGGGAPVVVQSMTLTKTHDVQATTAQIAALASAGCEIVRVAVPKIEDADALPQIVRFSPLPGDRRHPLQREPRAAAIDAGVAAVRINPGNIGGDDKVEQVVHAAKAKRHPDADRRQLGLAAEAPGGARAATTRPRRSSRRRSRRCACSSGSTTATSRSRVKSSHVPTMIRAYRHARASASRTRSTSA